MDKVIWAVDPFAKDNRIQLAALKALENLTESTKATIEPVAILSPDQLRLPKNTFDDHSKHYETKAEAIIKGWVKKLKSKRLTSPTLLVQDIYSTHITVDVLLRYAQETGASLIAVGTHNKKGLQRFFLGSFAETLILKSTTPVLIVNPKCPVKKKVSHILFPTDFSQTSKKAFEKLLVQAKALKARITLYFKFEYLMPETVEAIKLLPDYSKFQEADLKSKEALGEEWTKLAKSKGVKADIILDQKGIFIPDGILRTVKKGKIDMIAMASHSGAVSSALIGSVARHVVRSATVPVWVIHPDSKKNLRN